jgi:surface polysaccharide O-acyltransferase-like enzyme
MNRTSDSARFVEIDALKVAGILAVILIHSLRAPWDPGISQAELWLGVVTRFAVPGFLSCSGFLYATSDRIGIPTTLRRLRRVLIPYVIASIGAQLWWLYTEGGHTFEAILTELLSGSSFGPFYYVFVHFFLVLFSVVFARLPGPGLIGLTVAMLAAQAWLETRAGILMPIFWYLRMPLLWWGYFLLGWIVRQHYPRIQTWIAARRGALMSAFGLAILICTSVASADASIGWVQLAKWLSIYAILGFIFVTTCARTGAPAVVGFLSEATFAIYLFHLFFVYAAQRLIQQTPNEFDALVVGAYWGAGLFGALAIIAAVRLLMGTRSREIIGA